MSEELFIHENGSPIKAISINIVKIESLGEGVTRTICSSDLSDQELVRIHQVIYGTFVGNSRPYVWRLGDRIINNELVLDLIETSYQQTISQTLIIHTNEPTIKQ